MNALIKRLFSTSVSSLVLALLVAIESAIAGPIGFSVRSEGNDHLYQIDLLTGVAADLGLVGPVKGSDFEGLAFVGSQLYAIGTGTIFNHQLWNITNPLLSFQVGYTGIEGQGVDAGLDYDARTGNLYAYEGSNTYGALYSIDPATGVAKDIDPDTGVAVPIGENNQFADGLAIDKTGQAFVIDGIFSDSLYRLDLSDGAVSRVGSLGLTAQSNFGLSFDPSGILWGLNRLGEIYQISTATGAATQIANVTLNGTRLTGFEGLAVVPEPACLALFVIGLAGLGFTQRRRS